VTRSRGKLELGRDVLLFFEDRDRDTFVRGDRRLRRLVRKTVELARPNRQRMSGFEMSFRLLKNALTRANQHVRVNNFALALANPEFPIGIVGHNHTLKDWRLPNPAVLGPGLYDHPKQNLKLFDDARFRSFIVLCDWMRDLYSTGWGAETLVPWFGGINVADWADVRDAHKEWDFLVYDKIRWNRDRLVPEFQQPLLEKLTSRGLSFKIVRYGCYTLPQYRGLLKRSRAMLFLCEHETQGMAYQEAMASNLPVLAWDQGYWLDPNRPLWEEQPVKASSVPYFSESCGERFRDVADFDHALDNFWAGLNRYEPRAYVAGALSPAASAELYLRAYYQAAEPVGAGASRNCRL
jgi:hypothetical protein